MIDEEELVGSGTGVRARSFVFCRFVLPWNFLMTIYSNYQKDNIGQVTLPE